MAGWFARVPEPFPQRLAHDTLAAATHQHSIPQPRGVCHGVRVVRGGKVSPVCHFSATVTVGGHHAVCHRDTVAGSSARNRIAAHSTPRTMPVRHCLPIPACPCSCVCYMCACVCVPACHPWRLNLLSSWCRGAIVLREWRDSAGINATVAPPPGRIVQEIARSTYRCHLCCLSAV